MPVCTCGVRRHVEYPVRSWVGVQHGPNVPSKKQHTAGLPALQTAPTKRGKRRGGRHLQGAGAAAAGPVLLGLVQRLGLLSHCWPVQQDGSSTCLTWHYAVARLLQRCCQTYRAGARGRAVQAAVQRHQVQALQMLLRVRLAH